MSTFGKLLTGAVKSNTNQFNSIMLAVWTALYNSEFVQSNPEYLAIAGAIQALANIFLRFKTRKPISER